MAKQRKASPKKDASPKSPPAAKGGGGGKGKAKAQDSEYKIKRERNNAAVQKCRQSKKAQEDNRSQKISQLRQENVALTQRQSELEHQYQVMSQLVVVNTAQQRQQQQQHQSDAVPIVVVSPRPVVQQQPVVQQPSPTLLRRVILHPVSVTPAHHPASPGQQLPSPTLTLSLVPVSNNKNSNLNNSPSSPQPRLRIVSGALAAASSPATSSPPHVVRVQATATSPPQRPAVFAASSPTTATPPTRKTTTRNARKK